MYVKVFDEEHEKDLEAKVNSFLSSQKSEDILSIHYQVATTYDEREQIYCFSCLIVMRK